MSYIKRDDDPLYWQGDNRMSTSMRTRTNFTSKSGAHVERDEDRSHCRVDSRHVFGRSCMKFHELLQVCLAPDAPVLRVLTTPEDEVCRMNVRQLTDGLMRVIVRDFERGAYNGIKPSDLMHRVDHLLLSTERILKYLKSFKDGEYIEGLRREYRLNIRKAFGSVEERRDAYAPGDPDAVPDIKPFQKILNDLRDDIILLFLTRNVFPDYAMALERLKTRIDN